MQELTPFSTPETVNTYGVLPHQPGIELDLEHADVYFSETVILDENAKPIEREIGEPKPKGTPLEEVGKNPEEFSANFSQEYISYKQRVLEEDGSKEYVSYIEHQAKKIIKEKKLEIIKPATFVCIPTRNEEATSQSVAVAMDSLNQNSFCLVNHNFVTVPDQSVVDDIETIKKREDTQVIEGFARSNLGDARGLITDIACEIAYQLGVDISLSEFYKMKINVLNKLTDSISFSKFGAINQEEIFKVIDQYLSPSDRMYIKIRLLYKKVSGKI